MKNVLLLSLCTGMFVFGMVGVAGIMTHADTYVAEIYLSIILLFVSMAWRFFQMIQKQNKEIEMHTIFHKNSDIGRRRSGSDRRVFADSDYTGLEKRIIKDRRKGIRQRKLQRFLAKDLTFGKLHSESDEEIGQLLNISWSGLALRCFASGKETQDYSQLSIFLSGSDFAIGGIAIKTVSYTELANRSPFSTVIFKRYGVKFENLTREQKAGLDYFLINHVSG